jgi:outer membrane protein
MVKRRHDRLCKNCHSERSEWVFGRIFTRPSVLAVAIVLTLLVTAVPVQAAASKEAVELSLAECLGLAAKNNAQLKLAAVALDQAKLGLKEAKSGVRKIEDLEEMPGMSVPLDFDGRFFKDHGVWMAEQQVSLAQASYDLAGEGVRLMVINAYYDFLKAEADLKAAQAAEKEANEARRSVAAQAKVGLATPAQDLAAETGLAQARAGLLGAASARESKRLILLKEIGLDSDTNIKLVVPAETATEFVLEEIVKTALNSSIDIKGAQFEHDVAEKKFELTKKWYPDITHQYKEAEYAWLQSELKLADTKLAVETSVRSSYNMHLAAKEQLLPAERAIDQAKENLRLAQAKLKVGAATDLDVLQAWRTLSQAESNLIGIKQGYALALASLQAAEKGLTTGTSAARGGGSL